MFPAGHLWLWVYQPALQCYGVHVEFLHKSQVVVHILQTTQHLQSQRQRLVGWFVWKRNQVTALDRQYQQTSLCSQCQTSNVGFLSASTVSWDSVYCNVRKIRNTVRITSQEFHDRCTSEYTYLWVIGNVASWSHLLPILWEVVFALTVYSEFKGETVC